MTWSALKRLTDLAVSEYTNDDEEVEVYVIHKGSSTKVRVTDIVMSHEGGKPVVLIEVSEEKK